MTSDAFATATIAGTGHVVPEHHLTSADLDAQLGFEAGYLEQKTGMRSRYVSRDQSQVDLAVQAAELALADAEVDITDIDLVLGASGIPYQTIPTTAPLVMHRLGIPEGVEAFDVNSTCLSFVSALDVARARIAIGQNTHVLVFSSELSSRALPWDDAPEVAALFGDGAAAAVITAQQLGKGQLIASLMRSYPSAYEACQIPAGGTRIDYHNDPAGFDAHALFQMNGKKLFQITTKHFPGFVQDLLDRAGWRQDQVDLVIPHQASPLALTHMARLTGFGADRIVDFAAELGNQIAASIPTGLDRALRSNQVFPGARVLMLGTSAGVSFGGMAVQA